MHDTTDQVHWHEPKAGENAGFGKFGRPAMPYDKFMENEGIPVYRGIGVKRPVFTSHALSRIPLVASTQSPGHCAAIANPVMPSMSSA